jgi:hypothetical protein
MAPPRRRLSPGCQLGDPLAQLDGMQCVGPRCLVGGGAAPGSHQVSRALAGITGITLQSRRAVSGGFLTACRGGTSGVPAGRSASSGSGLSCCGSQAPADLRA